MGLTAGLGTRLHPFTLRRAKPSISFHGAPLLWHSLRPLENLPTEDLVLNLHWRPDDVKQTAGLLSNRWKVQFSDETQVILGSGGALAKAKSLLEPFDQLIVVNGDEVFIPENPRAVSELLALHLEKKSLCTLLTIRHPEVGSKFGGVWCRKDGSVAGISKQPLPETAGYHFVGIYILDPRALKYFSEPPKEENIFYDVLPRAMANGEKVHALVSDGVWYETGNVPDFFRATAELTKIFRRPQVPPQLLDLKKGIEKLPPQNPGVGHSDNLVASTGLGSASVKAKWWLGTHFNLEFEFEAHQPLRWPTTSESPRFQDELWKHTCFEIFLKDWKGDGYTEFNFSPSRDWAAYHFSSYRNGRTNVEIQPEMTCRFDGRKGRVLVRWLWDQAPARIGCSCILELETGGLEYYALEHSGSKPDFHREQDWKWSLQ